MQLTILESLGGKVAEKWAGALFTPAVLYWLGGCIAWCYRAGWNNAPRIFSSWSESFQIGILIGGLCLVVTSGFVMQRFDQPVLRFLEGYWPHWLGPFKRWLVARHRRRYEKNNGRWQDLKRIKPELLSDDECEELILLDWQQMHMPLPHQLMPTKLGNILRSCEQRALERYGLDAIVCWSRLWFLLPKEVKDDLLEARADLNAAARFWLWSVLFLTWTTIGAWWACPISAFGVCFTYYSWMLNAAKKYSELISASFDLYRHLLYQSLRMDLPAQIEHERIAGRDLTRFLWRGY